MWRDIRCNNSFKGRRDYGGWCGQLIMRISDNTYGTLEYRCPRCKGTKCVHIDVPATMAYST